jgi:hypothetical protein
MNIVAVLGVGGRSPLRLVTARAGTHFVRKLTKSEKFKKKLEATFLFSLALFLAVRF